MVWVKSLTSTWPKNLPYATFVTKLLEMVARYLERNTIL